MNASQAGRTYLHHAASIPRRQSYAILSSIRPFTRNYSTTNPTTPEVAGVTPQDIDGARTYCLNLLRKYDAPSYTLRAFIPAPAQDAYLALRALNIDVARISDITSNATIGSMRMQFWRDSITRALSLTPPKEPVAILLASAAATLSTTSNGTARFSKVWLHRLINTRESRLQNPPYPSLEALETYAENTYSTLLYLTLSALPLASVTADHVASHVGKAQGIAAVLRGLPLLAFPSPPPTHHVSNAIGGPLPGSERRQGFVPLPLDVMAECGVREDDVFRKGGEADGLKDAVFKVATRANDHLITAREMVRNVLVEGRGVGHEFEYGDDGEHAKAESARSDNAKGGEATDLQHGFGVFMPAVSTQMWLSRLEKAQFDAFDPSLRSAEWSLPWRAYWAHSRKKF